MKPKIFIACYGAGHVSMMTPVYKKLTFDKKVEVVALALSTAKNYFSRYDIRFKTLNDYKKIIMDKKSEHFGAMLADRWHMDSSGLTYEESILYLGVSMRDLVAMVGEAKAFRLLEEKGRQCFLPMSTMEKVINKENPDLIMTTNAPRMERAATLVGNKIGIPTINLHDDLGFKKRDYILSADKISVMSKITKDNLIEQGHDPDKISINGQPAFDTIEEELNNFDSDRIRKENGISNYPCLVLGTSMVGEKGKIMDITPLVCDTIEALDKKYQLIIKPHPSEDVNAYKDFASTRTSKPIVISDINIRELLFISEALITFHSTIMIESVLMGKPLISVNITGKANPVPYLNWGLGLEVANKKEMLFAINQELKSKNFQKKFKDARNYYFGGSLDSRASERISNLAYSLL